MSRSKKHNRGAQTRRPRSTPNVFPLAGVMFASVPTAFAQQAQTSGGLEEVVVTAQKRTESLQDVPLSIQAIGTERLEQLNVSGFNDYVQYLPSVSYQTLSPGFSRVFMRGAAAGDNGNHSGPLPGVGQYLDEQPITTIQGALDVHMYDIARVESLAGPQGTLYGASSQSGTIRIITNKPDKEKFEAGYGLEGNTIAGGDTGYLAEGFVNVPLGSKAAIRLVGWTRHDAGYIDNVEGTRTFNTSGITISNADRARDDYNEVDTVGARAALRIDLNDNWSITPGIMAQEQKSKGVFASDPSVGDLAVTHFHPESNKDRWTQAALTVEGRISNFDVTYAASHLKRDVDYEQDYSDYAFFYDSAPFFYGAYFYDNAGDLISPSQFIQAKDGYTKTSHELRVSSPRENRVRFVGGIFAQRQSHDIQQAYLVQDLADSSEVTGWTDTFWLTKQERLDRDYALFGEVTFDATDALAFTVGARRFRAENSLEGYFGFGFTNSFGSSTGEQSCPLGPDGPDYKTAPCLNLPLDEIQEDDTTYRLNATWRLNDDIMLYATASEGFRPGGVNRRGGFPPYRADFLTNYELGWKTSWAGNRLHFNGAVFNMRWEDFQFSYLGLNGLTNVQNAGNARINGVEVDVSWAASDQFTLYGGIALLDPELTQNFCRQLGDDGNELPAPGSIGDPSLECDPIDFAAEGSRLPTTPRFKGNLTARYEFPLAGFQAFAQGSLVHQTSAPSALMPADNDLLGTQDGYTLADFSFGIERDAYAFELFVDNATDERAELFRYAECATYSPGAKVPLCGPQPYIVTNRPRTIGLKFSQRF